MYDLGEVGVVADEEHAAIGARSSDEGERLARVEVLAQLGVLHGLDAERRAGQARGIKRARLRARERVVDDQAERCQRATRDLGLTLAALGQAPLRVGARVVALGLAVAQEPELLGHAGKLSRLGPAAHDDVVTTHEEAARNGRPPLLIIEPLLAFLDEHGLGEGELKAAPVGEGHSNVTYLVHRGDVEVVLRRPPRPPLPPSAHDVLRAALLVAPASS